MTPMEFHRAMELVSDEDGHGISVLMIGGGSIRGDYRINPRNDGLLVMEEYENGSHHAHTERTYTVVAISQIAAIARIKL